MKQLYRLALLVLVGFSLPACTQLPGINDQGFSGVTDVEVKFCPVDGSAEPKVCYVRWRDGKEKSAVAVEFDPKTGKFEYTAASVLAFDGQKARSEVEKVLADNQGKALKDIVPLVVEAIKKGL